MPSTNQENSLHSEITQILRQLAGESGENSKIFKHVSVSDVVEYELKNTDKTTINVIVVYMPFAWLRSNPTAVTKIINEIQNKKRVHTFILAKRTIVNKKADYNQRVPRSRTLTAVFDSYLEDLLQPGVIIGRRYRYRMNGSLLMKVFVGEDKSKYLQTRVDLIQQVYWKITNRKIAIEFKKQANYIKIKKVKKVKKRVQRRRKDVRNN